MFDDGDLVAVAGGDVVGERELGIRRCDAGRAPHH